MVTNGTCSSYVLCFSLTICVCDSREKKFYSFSGSRHDCRPVVLAVRLSKCLLWLSSLDPFGVSGPKVESSGISFSSAGSFISQQSHFVGLVMLSVP